MADPCFFHVDMDAFYASVEQMDNPALKGKPVIVGGTSNRGVVSACSYEARAFGVHSAMPLFQARRLCPEGIYLPVRMKRYLQMSRYIMDILSRFSPEIHQISIDEAFLDMTGTELLLGPPEHAAGTIKTEIRSATGLTISIGIGSSRFIAKMASEKGKPDGLFRVEPGKEIDFIDSCRIEDIWGIGKKAAALLRDRGIHRVSMIRQFTREQLMKYFGKAAGTFYFTISRGIDPGLFTSETKSRSVSNEVTLKQDVDHQETLEHLLFDLSHQVFFRTLSEHLIGGTAFIKIKYSDFTSVTAQKRFDSPIRSAEELFAAVSALFREKWSRASVRLLGVGMSGIEDEKQAVQQQELFSSRYDRKHTLEKTVQAMKESGFHLEKASSLLWRKNMKKHEKQS